MSKIFNLYTKNKDGIDVDRTWYQSSNIKYSECLDYDNRLKTLKVVFNNGTQYEYKNVNSQDYLLFRDASSQGKALNEYIKPKGYEYEKLDLQRWMENLHLEWKMVYLYSMMMVSL